MTESSVITVLIVTGAWVVLELLKYAYAQLLAAATRRKENNGRVKVMPTNPGNSQMSAGELRDHLREVKSLLGKVLDATNSARNYARQTLEEVKK